jgi:adenine-specific DNA-methyltransferase
LFAYLLTDTARQIFEDNSREYGNGLQKFEPNDLNKGTMLDLGKLSANSKYKIEALYRENKNKFISEIDKIFIENFS